MVCLFKINPIIVLKSLAQAILLGESFDIWFKFAFVHRGNTHRKSD